MSTTPEEEKRRAARIKFRPSDALEVRYKFLSHLEEFQCDQIFKGLVCNLSKGGALFVGPIPGSEWLPHLGQGQVLIGLNIMAPEDRVKVLASLRWTRPSGFRDPAISPGPCYELGVQFEQMDAVMRNNLSKLLIGHQLRTRKIRRSELTEGGGY